jgi:outer membrane protein assembly factor BamB
MISNPNEPTEYKLVLGNNATWVTAKNVAYYENGTMDYLKRYENRHAGSGCISPIFSEDNIMYAINGHWRVFYNESYNHPISGHWKPYHLEGGGPLPWNVPYGESIGVPELLNIGDGQIVYCDWDYSTMYGEYGTPTDAYGVTRVRDSEGFILAINMTDGTLLWKRVCSMGCYDPTVDPEKNLLWSTAGSYVKCYDATTGEDKWMFVNPTLKEAGQHSAYDGEKIYHNFWDGNAYALDAETGDIVWGPVYTDGFYSCGGGPVVSGESNLVYMTLNKMKVWRQPTTEPGLVVALDADTGDIVWQLDGWKDGGWIAGSVPVLADGRLYVRDSSARNSLICIGAGPTKTTVNLSSEQLKAGDTVLISGQLLDQSPESSGNYNAPCADCTMTLMYGPLGGTDVNTIATVTTGYAGDYYYEWTVPSNMTGMYSVLASYAGDNPSYIESSGQANFRVGEAGLSEAEMEQVTAAAPDYSMMFYAVIAVVIITLALVAFSLFIRKK